MLNALWIGLGELSNSGWQKWLVAAVVLAIVAGLVYVAWSGVRDESLSQGRVSPAASACCSVVLIAIFLFRGLGGYVETDDGGVRRRSPTWSPTSPTTTCG